MSRQIEACTSGMKKLSESHWMRRESWQESHQDFGNVSVQREVCKLIRLSRYEHEFLIRPCVLCGFSWQAYGLLSRTLASRLKWLTLLNDSAAYRACLIGSSELSSIVHSVSDQEISFRIYFPSRCSRTSSLYICIGVKIDLSATFLADVKRA